jgi:hypothetical protein
LIDDVLFDHVAVNDVIIEAPHGWADLVLVVNQLGNAGQSFINGAVSSLGQADIE